MTRILTLILCLLPFAAQAERVMTPAEFEAYSTGKTLDYEDDFSVWGREQYLPNRRVRFSYSQGECRFGEWYDKGDQVCFVYEDDPEPKCWTYFTDGKNITTVFENDGPGGAISTAKPTKERLECLGPAVGVSYTR